MIVAPDGGSKARWHERPSTSPEWLATWDGLKA